MTTTNRLVDAVGTHRRIRALITQAWSLPIITARSGYDAPYILRRAQIRPTAAYAIATLYTQLHRVIGPASKARHYAARHLYLPVHAWDYGYIDNPSPTAETEALAVWLEIAPDPAIPNGPLHHLLARLDLLLPRERAAAARSAHALHCAGDHRPLVLAGERLWQRDKWHRRQARLRETAAA